MSVWTTKALNRDRNYIVLQHPLKGMNYFVMGVKFRDSYAVVEKDSKTYHNLKKMPMLKNCKEYPLEKLGELSFITRNRDIDMVYGRDVYRSYVEFLAAKMEAERLAIQEAKYKENQENGTGCTYTDTASGKCFHFRLAGSPSGYCKKHILKDTRLSEIGITLPENMTKEKTEIMREKLANKLHKKIKVVEANGENNGKDEEQSQG